MKWTDVYEIAIELADTQTEIDPLSVNFVDLREWVAALPDFDDELERCNEKILEAIQLAWIEEIG
jgi:FeS assembly protein IscX